MTTKDWQTLTKLTGGGHIEIQRVRLVEQDVAIEGPFELPPLAQLSGDDQIFVAAFVRCHGSIKQMEKFFGVSYPTIKNRLNRIGAQLPFMEVEPAPEPETKRASASELLARLERGEMSAREVIAELKTPKEGERS
ncbi:MAG TPA: DUF2089 family protein [Vicinamibacterales bacterium]|jgi:hypothetical protein